MHSGYFVNGVPFWSWSDATSYNSAGIWHNLAMKFEQYDMDVCVGHSASGVYHRKCRLFEWCDVCVNVFLCVCL